MNERTSHSADETSVRALYTQLMDGWNQGSGVLFAEPFTEDGNLIGFDGMCITGRNEIAAFHQPLFDKWLKGTNLVGGVTDLRFLDKDVALMHAVGSTIMRGKSTPSPERDSIQTLVAVRQGNEWKLAAFQNTRIRPMGRSTKNAILWLFTDWFWKVFGPKS